MPGKLEAIIKRSKKSRKRKLYLSDYSFYPFFARQQDASLVQGSVEQGLQAVLQSRPIPENGLRLKVRLLHGYREGKENLGFAPVVSDNRANPDQSSHVALMGYLDNEGDVSHLLRGDWTQNIDRIFDCQTEMRFPLALLTGPNLPRSPSDAAFLYQIRFNVDQALADGRMDEAAAAVVAHGYVGVTARPFVQRMMEHQEEMLAGRGHLLHAVWRDLREKEIPHRVIAQIAACSEDEDAIYEMEEQAVAAHTLAPKGLNMIPGGRNGIANLQRLGFTGVTMENRDAVLASAIQQRAARMPFYRRSHLREYKPGMFTMVSGCWVRPAASRVAALAQREEPTE